MDFKALVSLLVLASLAIGRPQVRYTSQDITAKLYELRNGATVGSRPATELVAHGTRVKVEFSVSQPSEGQYENQMVYHLRNEDGTWKKIVMEYECREINMRKLCYSKTCPIADYKPAQVPRNMKTCMEVQQDALQVLKYMILNNPEILSSKDDLKKCMEAKTVHENDINKVCFNKAIVDMDRAVRDIQDDGYKLVQREDGHQYWLHVSPSSK